MPKKSIPQLKDKFQKGDKPMQEDFYDLLDSFIHRDEDISKILIKIASISEAENGSDNVKHMTPLLTKKAIYALTRLADIPDLATEVQQKIDASINKLLTLEDADNLINTVKDLLDFVKGAGEDLNIITELGKKVDKTSISHAIDSSSTTSVASSKAVNDAKNSARGNAVSDVRGGVASAQDTLKKLYDFFKDYYNSNNSNKGDVDWRARNVYAEGRVISKEHNDVKGERSTIAYQFTEGRGWGYNSEDDAVFYNASNDIIPFILNSIAAEFSVPVKVKSLIKKDGRSNQFLKADGSVDENEYLTPESGYYNSENVNKGDVDWRARNVYVEGRVISKEHNDVKGERSTIAYQFTEGRGWGYNSADDEIFYNAASGVTPFRVNDQGNAEFAGEVITKDIIIR